MEAPNGADLALVGGPEPVCVRDLQCHRDVEIGMFCSRPNGDADRRTISVRSVLQRMTPCPL
jgi:hypothetical protein